MVHHIHTNHTLHTHKQTQTYKDNKIISEYSMVDTLYSLIINLTTPRLQLMLIFSIFNSEVSQQIKLNWLLNMKLFHNRMIREENSHLRKTIEEREKQLTDLEDLRRMGRQQRRELQEAQAMLTQT